MRVAIDTSALTLLFYDNAKPRPNPATGQVVAHAKTRAHNFAHSILAQDNGAILIPTPVLTELLVPLAEHEKVLEDIDKNEMFAIVPFDRTAAVMLAEVNRRARLSSQKKDGSGESRHKVMFDRQIVAIAKAHGADIFYTDDLPQAKCAKQEFGLAVVHTWDL